MDFKEMCSLRNGDLIVHSSDSTHGESNIYRFLTIGDGRFVVVENLKGESRRKVDRLDIEKLSENPDSFEEGSISFSGLIELLNSGNCDDFDD